MALALDASSPVSNFANATTVACASFTPPANSLLVVWFRYNTGTGDTPGTPTVTDNLGVHLTYTLQQTNRNPDTSTAVDGALAVWTAPVTTSAAMTVTVASSGVVATGSAIKVMVWTDSGGVRPGVGTSGKSASASSISSVAQNFTATVTGSRGLLGWNDFNAAGAPTAGTGCTTTGGDSVDQGTTMSYAAILRSANDGVAAGTTTMNLTYAAASTDTRWIWLEITPPAIVDVPAPWWETYPPGAIAPNGYNINLPTIVDVPNPNTSNNTDVTTHDVVTNDATVTSLMTLTNTYEGGTNTTAITTGNSGGASGNAFDSITTAPTFTTAFVQKGTVAGSYAGTTVTTVATNWSASFAGRQDTFKIRDFFAITAIPGAISRIFQADNTSTATWGVGIDTSGHIGVRNLNTGSFPAGLLSTTVLTANVYHSYDLTATYNGTSWAFTFDLFIGANVDGTTPDESLSGSGVVLSSVDTYRFGWFSTAAMTWQTWHDGETLTTGALPARVAAVNVNAGATTHDVVTGDPAPSVSNTDTNPANTHTTSDATVTTTTTDGTAPAIGHTSADPTATTTTTDTTAPALTHTTNAPTASLALSDTQPAIGHTTGDPSVSQTTTDGTAPADTHTTNQPAPGVAATDTTAPAITHQTFDATVSTTSLVNANAELTNHAIIVGDPTATLTTQADVANHAQAAQDASTALAPPAGTGTTSHTTTDATTALAAPDSTAPAQSHTTGPATGTVSINADFPVISHNTFDATTSTATILNVNAPDMVHTQTAGDPIGRIDINAQAGATTHQTFDAGISTSQSAIDVTNPSNTHTTNAATTSVGYGAPNTLHSFTTSDVTVTQTTLAELLNIAHSTFDATVTTSLRPPAFVSVDTGLAWTNNVDTPYATRNSTDNAMVPGTAREGTATGRTADGTTVGSSTLG